MTIRCSRTNVYQVWDDEAGCRYEVTEDADGLGLCEIRYVDEVGKIRERLTLVPEMATLLRDCITDFLKDHAT